MNRIQTVRWTRRNRAFVLIFFALLSCERPSVDLLPTDSGETLLLLTISPNADTDPRLLSTGRIVSYTDVADSSLSLWYERQDEEVADSLVITETFRFSLAHPIIGDTTLNYGLITFDGVQVVPTVGAADPSVSTTYTSRNENGKDVVGYQAWYEGFRLGGTPQLSCISSPDLIAFDTVLVTVSPAMLVSVSPSAEIQATGDLHIDLSSSIPAGSIISIGSDSSMLFLHFELLRSSPSVTIPARYLGMVLGEAVRLPAVVTVTEGYMIGTLRTRSKNGPDEFSLPVFEFARHRVSTHLSR